MNYHLLNLNKGRLSRKLQCRIKTACNSASDTLKLIPTWSSIKFCLPQEARIAQSPWWRCQEATWEGQGSGSPKTGLIKKHYMLRQRCLRWWIHHLPSGLCMPTPPFLCARHAVIQPSSLCSTKKIALSFKSHQQMRWKGLQTSPRYLWVWASSSGRERLVLSLLDNRKGATVCVCDPAAASASQWPLMPVPHGASAEGSRTGDGLPHPPASRAGLRKLPQRQVQSSLASIFIRHRNKGFFVVFVFYSFKQLEENQNKSDFVTSEIYMKFKFKHW